MSIYGDLLSFFPEQFRKFQYFLMRPNVVASYSKREEEKTITGVFQYMKKGELRREEDTLADVNIPTLWTKEKLNIMYGFVQKGDELYRIVNTADWLFEGGFNVYILETFVGNSDVQTSFEDVDLGQNSYD